MKDDSLYLDHILQAIERIESYTTAGSQSFREDTKTQDAVIRNLRKERPLAHVPAPGVHPRPDDREPLGLPGHDV